MCNTTYVLPVCCKDYGAVLSQVALEVLRYRQNALTTRNIEQSNNSLHKAVVWYMMHSIYMYLCYFMTGRVKVHFGCYIFIVFQNLYTIKIIIIIVNVVIFLLSSDIIAYISLL